MPKLRKLPATSTRCVAAPILSASGLSKEYGKGAALVFDDEDFHGVRMGVAGPSTLGPTDKGNTADFV